MSLRLIDIHIDVLTTQGRAGYQTRFGPGLNVLSAPNSFGKSTLLQSIIFALGLEGMLTRSRAIPLGPVMTSVADLPEGRVGVVESSVTLTIANGQGKFLRARRFAKSSSYQSTLIQTWIADSEAGLATAMQVDTFVRLPGGATRDLGFHVVLADFLGWSLPQVPTFSGGEAPLYLETLFPLFFVEQKAGWSGVTPRMPTYLGLRDMLRRTVEFTLGLSTLDRLRAIAAIKEEISELRSQWTGHIAKAEAAASSESFRLAHQAPSPTGATQRRPMLLEAMGDESWRPLESLRPEWLTRLEALQGLPVATVGNRAESSSEELKAAEDLVTRMGGRLRLASENEATLRADLDALVTRLASVESDRRRLQDIRRLRTLGSELEVPLLAEDTCPTCNQSLDDAHSATGHASSLEATLALHDGERTTLLSMRAAVEDRIQDTRVARTALETQLKEARGRVRLLRDELVSASSAPSLVEVREQLWLQDRLSAAERVDALVHDVDESLDELSVRYDDLRARLAGLEEQPQSPEDAALIADFQARFVDQLRAYGLVSLPPERVAIDAESLSPTDDGFELRFDLMVGMSASDTIRTKWAYYVALLEAGTTSTSGHHPGLLIFDEPRQQEAARQSMASLVSRLGNAALSGAQILYATSEATEDLESFLTGISYTRLPAQGPHLLTQAAADS